jgi:hypothetical protein
MISDGISAPMPCQSPAGHLYSLSNDRTPHRLAPDRNGKPPSCAELTHQDFKRSGSGKQQWRRASHENGRGLVDGGIMPVFCPTGQAQAQPAQAIEMTTPGYCAWGCFFRFLFAPAKKVLATSSWPGSSRP